MGLSFEWDYEKSRKNQKKHGISFEEAATVFGDPFALTIPDQYHSQGEQRFIIIGESIKRRILLVVNVEKTGRIRIISARRANKREKRNYEEKN